MGGLIPLIAALLSLFTGNRHDLPWVPSESAGLGMGTTAVRDQWSGVTHKALWRHDMFVGVIVMNFKSPLSLWGKNNPGFFSCRKGNGVLWTDGNMETNPWNTQNTLQEVGIVCYKTSAKFIITLNSVFWGKNTSRYKLNDCLLIKIIRK